MVKNIDTFYYNLSTMLDAGLPITRALSVSSKTSGHNIRKVILKIEKFVSEGNTLSAALSEFPKLFEPLDIDAINAAEESGHLPEILKMLADSHQFFQKIIKRITSGLILPALILFIAAFVIPLPYYFFGWITLQQSILRSLAIISIFLIPGLCIYAIIKFTPKTGPLRYLLDIISLKIPILRKGLEHLAVSRFSYTFHLLLKAGVPIIQTMEISVKSATNLVVAGRFKNGIKKAQAGHNISEGFKKPLPFGFIDLWKTGEESGQLEIITKKLADINSDAASHNIEQFAFWLPKFVYSLVCIMMIIAILMAASSVYGSALSF
jgi:type II secretory pathway component PulF